MANYMPNVFLQSKTDKKSVLGAFSYLT